MLDNKKTTEVWALSHSGVQKKQDIGELVAVRAGS